MSELEVSVYEDKSYITVDGKEHVVTLNDCIDAFVSIKGRTSPQTERVAPSFNEYRESYDGSIGVSKVIKNKPVNEIHEKLVNRVREIVENLENDDYFQGYVDGSNERKSDIFQKFVHKRFEADEQIMREITDWLIEDEILVCSRNKAVYPLGEGGMPSNSYVYNVYKEVVGKCENCGSDLSETKETIKSTHNTRVSDEYKCTNCGHKWKGRITG